MIILYCIFLLIQSLKKKMITESQPEKNEYQNKGSHILIKSPNLKLFSFAITFWKIIETQPHPTIISQLLLSDWIYV